MSGKIIYFNISKLYLSWFQSYIDFVFKSISVILNLREDSTNYISNQHMFDFQTLLGKVADTYDGKTEMTC